MEIKTAYDPETPQALIEFMSDHPLNNPGGCFYHHCADISISGGPSDGGSASDATVGS